MNEHGKIVEQIARQYELWGDAVIVSPSALAHSVYSAVANGDESDIVNFLSIEQLKQMCRAFLRRRNDDDGEENEVYAAQGNFGFGDVFTGKLQDRYPVPRVGSSEPVYKRRADLTAEERHWNVMQLRKSGQSRLKHADALEAEGNERAAA